MHALNDASDARRLITQAGQRLAQITGITEVDDGSWCIDFDGGDGFAAEWSPGGSRLVLTADLGLPTPEGELSALNLALSYNALWREIGDLRIARDGDEGELMLIGELGPEDSEPETFNAALLHFVALRRWWADAIARAASANPAPPAPPGVMFERI
ncbi:type III secretion system chaperone [Hydrogenophaga sp. SNF1]|nr:type III secretion system chaperone [Hydrogenophaga sp. SNF1]WQB85166.1 type III secretion system chaperone [Hydrogenophaga sp. SNF1]